MYLVRFSRARYTEPNFPLPSGLPISKSSRHHCLPFLAASAVDDDAVLWTLALALLELDVEEEEGSCCCWLTFESGARWSVCDRFIPGDEAAYPPYSPVLFSLMLVLLLLLFMVDLLLLSMEGHAMRQQQQSFNRFPVLAMMDSNIFFQIVQRCFFYDNLKI